MEIVGIFRPRLASLSVATIVALKGIRQGLISFNGEGDSGDS